MTEIKDYNYIWLMEYRQEGEECVCGTYSMWFFRNANSDTILCVECARNIAPQLEVFEEQEMIREEEAKEDLRRLHKQGKSCNA
jgi:hypothetical protein